MKHSIKISFNTRAQMRQFRKDLPNILGVLLDLSLRDQFYRSLRSRFRSGVAKRVDLSGLADMLEADIQRGDSLFAAAARVTSHVENSGLPTAPICRFSDFPGKSDYHAVPGLDAQAIEKFNNMSPIFRANTIRILEQKLEQAKQAKNTAEISRLTRAVEEVKRKK